MPSDVRFAELRKLLESHGWTLVRIRGSHHVFTHPTARGFAIPVHKNKVKHVYLREVERTIRELEEGQEEPGG